MNYSIHALPKLLAALAFLVLAPLVRAQRPVDPVTPYDHVVESRLLALEAASNRMSVRVMTNDDQFAVFSAPRGVTFASTSGALRATTSPTAKPANAYPIVWIDAGGSSSGGAVTNLGTGLSGSGTTNPLSVADYALIRSNSVAAFGWGDHALAGYLKANLAGATPTNAGAYGFSGTTNLLGTDGTNLTFGGRAIAGSGSGFPLTNNGNLARFALTNGSLVEATTGRFSRAEAGTGAVAGDFSIAGDLFVQGSTYHTHYIYNATNVTLGVSTTYLSTVCYSTNFQYLFTYVIEHTTNFVFTEEQINVGGTRDDSLASWVRMPHIYDSATGGVAVTGPFDLTGASVTGLPSQGVTNLGSGLTGNGTNQPLAVAWGQATAALLTNVNWAAFLTAESDPAFAAWLAVVFTNAVDARVSSIAVTNATVLSFGGTNLVGGAIELSPGSFVLDGSTLSAVGGGAQVGTAVEIVGANGTAVVSSAVGQVGIVRATNAPLSVQIGSDFPSNALHRIWLTIERGTNSSFALFNTNSVSGAEFLSVPASSTNRFRLSRFPFAPRWSVFQIYE